MATKRYPILKNIETKAHITQSQYRDLYQRSINDPEGFWGEQAEKFITWSKPWTTVLKGDFKNLNVEWFVGAKLNACYNCLDRHLPKRANQTAILWEGDDPLKSSKLTYAELHEKVCRLANSLKKLGVKKGDKICIYLPMIPEAAIAMLACARIGAVHSVIFGGFSPEALTSRILDADCRMIITANEGFRSGKIIPLKKNVDAALQECANVKNVIVVKHTDNETPWQEGRDQSYEKLMQAACQ